MPRGRPAEWRIDPHSGVRKAVLELDKRGRITMGAGIVEVVGRELLAVLDEAGRVRLLPWMPHGGRVRERIAELNQSVAENIETLQRLESRYERVTVDSQGRLVLPPGARLHLAVERGRVVVWQLPGAFEIWSPEYSKSVVAEEFEEDLP